MKVRFIIAALFLPFLVLAQTRHEELTQKYREGWDKLIPTHVKSQFAGSMGMLSAGIGWDYGKKRQWETDLLFGIVPGNKHREGHATFTLKETYTPFRINLGNDFHYEPLTTGLYMTRIFGEYFWAKQPSRYPKGYYFWSVNTRFNVFLGQSITIPVNSKHLSQSLSLFFEVNTNDLYFISYIGNEVIKLNDIIGISAGVRFRFFD